MYDIITTLWETSWGLNKMVSGSWVEKAMAPHSSTLAWKIPWTEEPGRLQSKGSLRVGHDWTTSLSLFTFMHWRRKWQPTPVFLPGESQGRGSQVGCRLWGRTESDTTEATAAAAAAGSWNGVWPIISELWFLLLLSFNFKAKNLKDPRGRLIVIIKISFDISGVQLIWPLLRYLITWNENLDQFLTNVLLKGSILVTFSA